VATGSLPASTSAVAMQARSIAASARFLRTYSKSTAGLSAFVPFGPRIKHSSPWSRGWVEPTS